VFMLGAEAAERLVAATDPEGRTLGELRALADAGTAIVELGGELALEAELTRSRMVAENVGGLLPGRGALAGELIVIGAHLDHIGMGRFGSRSGPGELHPGADDNASGSAAVLMLADRLARSYAELPDDADLRSLLFVCFSAEESGLNGSRHYVANAVAPLEDHALMINFDMIGRIRSGRLSVSGVNTVEGMAEWLEPVLAESPLEIVQPKSSPGASDHSSFLREQIPALFAIIADFHGDYHTPADVSWKINRAAAVQTVDLFHRVALDTARRAGRFQFVEPPQSSLRGFMSRVRVRVGIAPGSGDGELGVEVRSVSPGLAAEEAGVLAGDRLVRWDGRKIDDVAGWLGMLVEHEPGDVVRVGVLRDGEEVTLSLTLRAR